MKNHSFLLPISILFWISSLSAPYLLAGHEAILLILPVAGILWLVGKRHNVFWTATILLIVNVLLIILGIILKLSIIFLLLAFVTAIAIWELLLSNEDQQVHEISYKMNIKKNHIKSLGISTGIGLGLVLATQTFAFKMSMWFILSLGIALFLLLTLVFREKR